MTNDRLQMTDDGFPFEMKVVQIKCETSRLAVPRHSFLSLHLASENQVTKHLSYALQKKYLYRPLSAQYFRRGEMAEWSIAAVLKTVDVKASGGSNP
ncbi:MAG: hypothetical protein RL040_676, partial [Bacteroidota bacterium]